MGGTPWRPFSSEGLFSLELRGSGWLSYISFDYYSDSNLQTLHFSLYVLPVHSVVWGSKVDLYHVGFFFFFFLEGLLRALGNSASVEKVKALLGHK